MKHAVPYSEDVNLTAVPFAIAPDAVFCVLVDVIVPFIE